MVSLDVVDVGAVLLVQQLVHDRLKAHGHEHRLLAVDGDPLELVLRHQVLERQLQVVGRLAAALRRRVGGDFLVLEESRKAISDVQKVEVKKKLTL